MVYIIRKSIFIVALLFAKNIYANVFHLKYNDNVLGNMDAPITVIEYSTLTCVHCASFHASTFDKIKKYYIEHGKVKWINRQFIMDQPSLKGALLASCNPKNYYKMLKILFLKQSAWAFNKNFEEILKNFALLSGISSQEFQKCMNDEVMKNYYADLRKEAKMQLDIKGTPTFYMNNKEVDLFNFENFEKEYNNFLKGNKE